MRTHAGVSGFSNATHLRFDALFAGVTLGWFWHFRREAFAIPHKNWQAVIGLYSQTFSYRMYTSYI